MARGLRVILREFLYRLQRGNESAQILGRLVVWLLASSVFMAVKSLVMVAFLVVMLKTGWGSKDSDEGISYCVFIFLLAFCRIMKSFAHIRSVSKGSAVRRFVHWGMTSIRQRLPGRSTSTVAPISVNLQDTDAAGPPTTPDQPAIMLHDMSQMPDLSVVIEENSQGQTVRPVSKSQHPAAFSRRAEFQRQEQRLRERGVYE